MATVPRSLRVSESVDRALTALFRRRGVKEWSAGAAALLDEAVRSSRVPGIVFVDGVTGRRAAVAFSGLEVWEIVATWKEAGERFDRLRAAIPELSDAQLQAALRYYELYPSEVDDRLALEAEWTPERTRELLPFTRASELRLDD